MKCCCNDLDRLISINISDNKIHTITSHTFKSLNEMVFIDISNNRLANIGRDCFLNITKLCRLILFGNFLLDISLNIFNTMQVSIILTELCCMETRCTEDVPWYASCFRLFQSTLMRVCFHLISCTILLFNCISLSHNVLKMRKCIAGKTYHLIVCFINAGDMLCGFYLAIIYGADIVFKDSFIISDMKWRQSLICFLAFGLAFEFSIIMPYFLTYLSMVRLMVFLFPFNRRSKNTSFVARCLVIGILVSFIGVAIIALLLSRE